MRQGAIMGCLATGNEGGALGLPASGSGQECLGFIGWQQGDRLGQNPCGKEARIIRERGRRQENILSGNVMSRVEGLPPQSMEPCAGISQGRGISIGQEAVYGR